MSDPDLQFIMGLFTAGARATGTTGKIYCSPYTASRADNIFESFVANHLSRLSRRVADKSQTRNSGFGLVLPLPRRRFIFSFYTPIHNPHISLGVSDAYPRWDNSRDTSPGATSRCYAAECRPSSVHWGQDGSYWRLPCVSI